MMSQVNKDSYLLTIDIFTHLYQICIYSNWIVLKVVNQSYQSKRDSWNWWNSRRSLVTYGPSGLAFRKCNCILLYSCTQNYSTLLAFPYDFYRNRLCNIDCCVNSMRPINQNMIVSQGLELELSMFRRTTMSGQHHLI